MPANQLQELIQSFKHGELTRRQFLNYAVAMGLSATAARWALYSASVSAQETPTPEPTQTPIAATINESASVKISYWTILSGPDGDEMSALVQKFGEENPDIGVESLQGLLDFVPKMQAAAISGTAPDVALLRNHYIGAFASTDVLSPVTNDEMGAHGINSADFDPTVWGFTTYQDEQYTIPLDIHCFAMLFNKTRITDAGLEVPTTLDELKAVATATTNVDEQVCGYQNWIATNPNNQEAFPWLWFMFQNQFGGEFLSEDGSEAAFNGEQGVAALTMMKELEDAGNPQSLPYFNLQRDGKVVTWPDGPWIITAMFNPEQAPAAADLDAAPFPQQDPNAPAVWAQSHQFSFPKQSDDSSERREASLKFVQWMTEHSADWSKAGQIPAHNGARAEVEANTEDLYLQKLKQGWIPELEYAKFMPTDVPTMLELLPRLGSHLVGCLLGQESVEDALNSAEEEVNDIIANG
jgi:multiple sugar transport system substrate-binding protein